MIAAPPATLINAVLDTKRLPHVRHLRCDHKHLCRGAVDSIPTTWRVTNVATLLCLCYLRHTPQPIATPVEALRARVPHATNVRCGSVTCRATYRGVTTFYVAVKWRSDGLWHFRSIGAVS